MLPEAFPRFNAHQMGDAYCTGRSKLRRTGDGGAPVFGWHCTQAQAGNLLG